MRSATPLVPGLDHFHALPPSSLTISTKYRSTVLSNTLLVPDPLIVKSVGFLAISSVVRMWRVIVNQQVVDLSRWLTIVRWHKAPAE
jgi:hypothetical protein